MDNFFRQTERTPGVDIQICMSKWKEFSLDKLAQEEEKMQEAYFVMKENPALESQIRFMLESLQKYIQHRYQKEDNKNQKKINL
jgi:hypothetical protein